MNIWFPPVKRERDGVLKKEKKEKEYKKREIEATDQQKYTQKKSQEFISE